MISLLIPTRGRHHRLPELLNSLQETCQREFEVLFATDDDDNTNIEEIIKNYKNISIKHIVTKKQKLGNYYNLLLPLCSGNILFYGADDIVFRTLGWDVIIAKEFDKYWDEILLISTYEIDNYLPVHGFISNRSCKILGYVFPDYFEHGYLDRWLHDMYRQINRFTYIPNIYIEHKHWHADKSLYDDTYDHMNRKDSFGKTPDDRDKLIFHKKTKERERDAKILIKRSKSISLL